MVSRSFSSGDVNGYCILWDQVFASTLQRPSSLQHRSERESQFVCQEHLLPAICFSVLCSLTLSLKGGVPPEENLATPVPNARTDLFEALKKGKIQAVLYDEPFLRYEIRTQYKGEFTVVPLHLDTQLYASAVREGAPLREPINRVLLRKIHEPAWRDLVYNTWESRLSSARPRRTEFPE